MHIHGAVTIDTSFCYFSIIHFKIHLPLTSMIQSYIAYGPDKLPLTSTGINRQIRGILHALIAFLKQREEWYIK
jgi:hypothetical protein